MKRIQNYTENVRLVGIAHAVRMGTNADKDTFNSWTQNMLEQKTEQESGAKQMMKDLSGMKRAPGVKGISFKRAKHNYRNIKKIG